MTEIVDAAGPDLPDLTSAIVVAYVKHNAVAAGDLPSLIARTHMALASLGQPVAEAEPERAPAVPVRKSVTPDFLICLEDGKKFKSLNRHLRVHFDLSPEQYRQKWNLPTNYPMTAPNYAAVRASLARASGLGRKPAEPAVAVMPTKPVRKKLGLNFGKTPAE